MSDSPLSLSFPALKSREVTLRFDGGDVTSDAGLALLALADRKLGVTAALAATFQDRRQARKVDHPAAEIIAARVYAIAQGYEDGNDFDRLRHDPGLKTVCGHLPASGQPLTSQETLSRFEHAPTARDLVRMGWALADQVIAQVPADSSRVWIDVDPYDDPCHGRQQLSLFNGFYDEHCYLPLAVCVTGADGVNGSSAWCCVPATPGRPKAWARCSAAWSRACACAVHGPNSCCVAIAGLASPRCCGGVIGWNCSMCWGSPATPSCRSWVRRCRWMRP